MTGTLVPRWCDRGCGTRIILATRAFTGRTIALEAQDQPPFSDHAAGALIVVGRQAFTLNELLEDLKVRKQMTDDQAREFAAGHPWHRAHHDEDGAA